MKRWRVRHTRGAQRDFKRLFQFLADRDPEAAASALELIREALRTLESMPLACRQARQQARQQASPLLRELVIPFGSTGYVALFEIESDRQITVLAVRHQRERDLIRW